MDVLELPDGALLVSDDQQGVLYRVRYTGERVAAEVDGDQAQVDRDQILADLPTAGRFKAGTCRTCHGGNGVTLFPAYLNLAGQVAPYSEAQLHAFREGERTSPLMKDAVRHLSDGDIEMLAACYAAKAPMKGNADPALAAHGKLLYEGEKLADRSHASIACHGSDGEGNAAAPFPALRGQRSEYDDRVARSRDRRKARPHRHHGGDRQDAL
ncbi:MAG TPA: hypothetical protein VLE23_05315 [Geminicoccaceae bacterium]|nr:hypothetical protein [Geminicoccaceae bacterium]